MISSVVLPFDGPGVDRSWFARPAPVVAAELIGAVLLVDEVGGIVVETEAYTPDDPASHSVRLRRSRARMGGAAGLAYVHRSHGLHDTLNVVTGVVGEHAAVLIRAVEPAEGVTTMRERRGVAPTVADARLGAGPGNLARALAITLADDGRDLTADAGLTIAAAAAPVAVHVSTRIGLTKAADWPWRFYDPTSRSVSAHRRGAEVT